MEGARGGSRVAAVVRSRHAAAGERGDADVEGQRHHRRQFVLGGGAREGLEDALREEPQLGFEVALGGFRRRLVERADVLRITPADCPRRTGKLLRFRRQLGEDRARAFEAPAAAMRAERGSRELACRIRVRKQPQLLELLDQRLPSEVDGGVHRLLQRYWSSVASRGREAGLIRIT